MDIIDSKLKVMRKSTPKLLLQSLFKDDWNQAQALPTLWYLIGTLQINTNLDIPLSMNSEIWYLYEPNH